MAGFKIRGWRKREASAGRAADGSDAAFGRILANTAWLLGGKGVGAVLSLFYLAIITRTLGVADFGRFALITSTAQAISVLVTFESWQIVVRFGQTHLQGGAPHALNRLIRFCILIDMASALAGCAIAAGIVILLGPWLGLSDDLSAHALLFCAVMLIGIRSTPMGMLRLFDRFDTGTLAETVVPVVRMVGALVVLASGPSVTRFLMVWGAAELLCAGAYWVLALRTVRGRIGSWRSGQIWAARDENPGLVGFLTATNLSTTFSSAGKQVAVLIVGLFTGPVGAGLYRLAYQLNQALAKISQLLSRTVFAELSRASACNNMDDLRALLRRTNRLALVSGAAIVVLVLLTGQPLLRLIAGPSFDGAYPILLVLGIAAAIEVVGLGFGPLLMATGRTSRALQISLATTALLLTAQTLLLPIHGPIGAAYANVLAAIVGLALLGWASRAAIRR
ncbi:lipopolysaccharide biosynthesis protein [Sphingobium algorifonticola]|uniref:lipopolysaccharide biosynthesis protein n=1 Tax=Sphingobium algorifonticola TaxID=2008318 RepID=UPI0026BBA493